MKKISYSKAGVKYEKMDPIKKLAQIAASSTSKNLVKNGLKEISETRGESAYVWKQGNVLMASVIEGLGTKNLVADELRKITGKTYYEVVGHDSVAAIINDLISVGATPIVINAYWAVGDSNFLSDTGRITDLIKGWKSACDLAGASWGGGETPTYKGIISPTTIDLGGSAVGIIGKEKYLVVSKNLNIGDRIILLKSTGINANGLSLARFIATKLPKKYATRMPNGEMYGEAIMTKTNIYAKLVQNMQNANINIHYLSNITGHGLRKIMRANQNLTYVIEKLFEPQAIFEFIKKHANLSDYECYDTYNMGQDYAIFVSPNDLKKTLNVIKRSGFEGIDAGYVEKGKRQVIIKPKNITFKSETLDLR